MGKHQGRNLVVALLVGILGAGLVQARGALVGSWSGDITGKCKETNLGRVCAGKGKVVIVNTSQTETSAPTTVTFYLSDSCTPQPGDLQLGAVANLKALKPGKKGKASMKATLPAGVNPEGKFIVAVIGPAEDGNTVCYGPIGID